MLLQSRPILKIKIGYGINRQRRVWMKLKKSLPVVILGICIPVAIFVVNDTRPGSSVGTIGSISPSRGYIGGNNLVTINGSGLISDPTFPTDKNSINSASGVAGWLDSEGQIYESTVEYADTSFLNPADIKEVDGGLVRAILTNNGEVWTTPTSYAKNSCPSTNLNNYGAYGNGTTSQTSYPSKVGGLLTGKKIVDVDGNNWSGVMVALDDQGKVYTWGRDLDGELGNNATLSSSSTPVQVNLSVVPSGSKIIAVSAGTSYYDNSGCAAYASSNSHVLALDDKGKIYAWGYNGQGQLGINNTTNQPVPVAVTGGALSGKKIIKILAGYRTSFAIDENGKLYAWGTNVRGQLGDGTVDQRNLPITTNISMTNGTIKAVGNGGGYNYNSSDGETMILDSAGKIYLFGRVNSLPANYTNSNIVQNCGDRTGVRCSYTPIPAPFPSTAPPFINNISSGYSGWALGSDGKLYNAIIGSRIFFDQPRTVVMDPDGIPANCLDVTIVSDSQITCVTSAHVEGTVDVKVDIGPNHMVLEDAFNYAKLNITSITPSTGPEIGGTELIIRGQDFTKMESTKVIQNYTYTGSAKQFNVTEESDYILETWGASGGKNGGKGGYSTGKLHLEPGDNLYINVGEAGGSGCLGRTTFGGGGAGYGTSGTCSGSGGGATDMRVNANSLKSRVIVAGGGGGDASVTPSPIYAENGVGGGFGAGGGSAIDPKINTSSNGAVQPGAGANQTQGGGGGHYGYSSGSGFSGTVDAGLTGTFGVGGNTYHSKLTQVAGAGGGGWYGGGSGVAVNDNNVSTATGGGGGSGWIYTDTNYNNWLNGAVATDTTGWQLTRDYFLSSAQTIAGNLSMPDYNNDGKFMNGNSGNGYARITRYEPNQQAVASRKVILDKSGSSAACNITYWSDTEIRCVTTAHNAGLVDITIGNDIEEARMANAFTYRNTPKIDEVSPSSGLTLGGKTVLVTGDNFIDGDTEVKFGGEVADCTFINTMTLSCETPAHAAGLVEVVVTTSNGSDNLPSGFTYYVPSISLTLNDDTISMGGSPGQLLKDWLTATVVTDNPTGYHLDIEAEESDLICSVKDSYRIKTLSSTGAMAENRWGWYAGSSTPTATSNWHGLDDTDGVVKTFLTDTDSTLGDDTVLWLGAKPNLTLPACKYLGEIVLTAISNEP